MGLIVNVIEKKAVMIRADGEIFFNSRIERKSVPADGVNFFFAFFGILKRKVC
jgi:hypothetical protein